MRPGSNARRPRGRSHRKHGGNPRNYTYDSNGPDVRIRGNAHQVYEKYLALGRDATSSGDRIAAEGYFQHAEHYFRIMNDSTDPQPNGQAQRERYRGRDGEEPFDGQEEREGYEASRDEASEQPSVESDDGGARGRGRRGAPSHQDGEGEGDQQSEARQPRRRAERSAAERPEGEETEQAGEAEPGQRPRAEESEIEPSEPVRKRRRLRPANGAAANGADDEEGRESGDEEGPDRKPPVANA